VSGEGQQSDVASLLDGAGEAALVRGANAGEPPGHDLAALGYELLEQANIAVRDAVDFLGAELAHLLATEKLATTTGAAAGARAARATRARAVTGAAGTAG